MNDLNKSFKVARSFAILSVISAHIHVPSNHLYFNALLGSLGTIGVVVFIFLAGFYFNPKNEDNFASFSKKKFQSIGLPWLCLGSLGLILPSLFTSTAITLGAWALWLIGYQTYLWFLSVLIVCYVFFYWTNKSFLYFALVLNLFSLYLTSYGYLDFLFSDYHITPYLNVFNWVGFFALGRLLASIDKDLFYLWLVKLRLPMSLLFISLTCITVYYQHKITYFTVYGPIYELVGCVSILGISSYVLSQNNATKLISKYSFCIYLTHFFIIGIVHKLYSQHFLLLAVSPFLVLLLTTLIVSLGLVVSRKLKVSKLYCLILGLRTN